MVFNMPHKVARIISIFISGIATKLSWSHIFSDCNSSVAVIHHETDVFQSAPEASLSSYLLIVTNSNSASLR